MRITRNQLRQIIQEELGRLHEQGSKAKVATQTDEPVTPYLDDVTGQVKITYSVDNLEKESSCYDVGQELDTAWQKVYTRTYMDLMKNPRIVHCETGEVLVTTPPEYYED